MSIDKTAFLIAGTSSGCGKTTATLAIMTLLSQSMNIASFKCGPDYIDSELHSLVTGKSAENLDPYMMSENYIHNIFAENLSNSDCAIVEGAMGLFDGVSIDSNFGSSAHISEILDIPIILTINAKGAARSVAALVSGYCNFSKGLNIAGILANNINSKHHANLIKSILEKESLPPLVGYIPKDKNLVIQERHLGLTLDIQENKLENFKNSVIKLKDTINVDKISKLTKCKFKKTLKNNKMPKKLKKHPIIAVAKDYAFRFYYNSNLKILKEHGAIIKYFSPLNDTSLPNKTKMVYLGGGYPELFSDELSLNIPMIKAIRDFYNSDGYIYAECGGLMYLTESITKDSETNKLCGIIHTRSIMEKSLRRLGYREVYLKEDTVLGSKGISIRGHEFHYSKIINIGANFKNIFKVSHPVNGKVDTIGIKISNVLASYIHLFWGDREDIADNIVTTISE